MHRIVRGPARWAVFGVVAVVLMGACGDDKDDGNDSSGDTPAATTLNVLAGVNDQQDPNIVVTEFLPSSITIAAGSSVEWRIAGPEPHSVTFFAEGTTPPSPESPEGQALFAPSIPPSGIYDGKSLANSGLGPLGPTPAPPFRLTFPTEGEFSYACVIHPTMTGKVTVAESDATVDSQGDVNTRADSELNQWLEEGRAAKKKLADTAPKQTPNDNGSTTWTYEMGATTEHTDVLAFSPASGEVRPGDSVSFVNGSLAPHTATFASGGTVIPDPTNPAATTATGPSPLTLLETGGPYNSGLVPPAAPPNAPPPEGVRTFTFVIPGAGTYNYICVFHIPSGMGGSIKVA